MCLRSSPPSRLLIRAEVLPRSSSSAKILSRAEVSAASAVSPSSLRSARACSRRSGANSISKNQCPIGDLLYPGTIHSTCKDGMCACAILPVLESADKGLGCHQAHLERVALFCNGRQMSLKMAS